MDIFDYAIRMENDGEKFYRHLAEQTSHEGIKAILTMLGDDELRHIKAIELARSETPSMPDTAIIDDASNIFQRIKDNCEPVDISDQAQLFKKALQIEIQACDFYKKKADEAILESHRDIFQRLSELEQVHCAIIKEIMQYTFDTSVWM